MKKSLPNRSLATALCLGVLSLGISGCDKAMEATAEFHATVSKAWDDYSQALKTKKQELARKHDPDQDSSINISSIQKAVREEVVSAGTSMRDEAVSVVKEGTKQALEEAKDGVGDAVNSTTRVASDLTSNAAKNIGSAEKSMRETVVYYVPALPKSEKEAQQMLFGSSGGMFEDLGLWLKSIFRRGTGGSAVTTATSKQRESRVGIYREGRKHGERPSRL